MAYTEVSVYQYITGDELEAQMCVTFANIDAKYTEAAVMLKVSQAERWINGICGQSFTAGAAPDGVVFATLIMAERFMTMQMAKDGYVKAEDAAHITINDALVIKSLSSHNVVGVDSIAMSGINSRWRRGD